MTTAIASASPMAIASASPMSNKTKKVKQPRPDKKALWLNFDKEEESFAKPVECIFRAAGERELCDCCQSNLAVTDEGFLGCTNKGCGVIYTDMLDQGAEWRYYGADDNQSGDPTRCGMPINPL